MSDVAVVNASTAASDTDVSAAVAALQSYMRNVVKPVWGFDPVYQLYAKTAAIPATARLILIKDTSDAPGALGYHDLAAPDQPVADVFWGDDLKYGSLPSVTLGHEAIEMEGDPYINKVATAANFDGQSGRLYAFELCDANEDDSNAVDHGGVAMSAFVYLEWFSPAAKGKLDSTGKIAAPFQILTGGYIGYCDVGSGLGWQQLTMQLAPGWRPMRSQELLGSRFNKRKRRKLIA